VMRSILTGFRRRLQPHPRRCLPIQRRRDQKLAQPLRQSAVRADATLRPNCNQLRPWQHYHSRRQAQRAASRSQDGAAPAPGADPRPRLCPQLRGPTESRLAASAPPHVPS
ncbi:hypothetical protein T310_6873, partial [Rasamsonia emersonii CBS 393.64]